MAPHFHEQRKRDRDEDAAWTPEQRAMYQLALKNVRRRQNARNVAALGLVVVASIVGAIWSGNEAGQEGAKAGRAQVEAAAKKYAYDFQLAQTNTLRTTCVITSGRTAYIAALGLQLEDRVRSRGAAGDEESANRYLAAAEGIISTIPGRLPERAETRIVKDEKGKLKIVITDRARKALEQSCAERYANPPKP